MLKLLIFTTYKNLISKFGYNKVDFTLVMREVQSHISDNTLLELDQEDNDKYVLTEPRNINIEVSIKNLEELSVRAFSENDYYNINEKK